MKNLQYQFTFETEEKAFASFSRKVATTEQVNWYGKTSEIPEFQDNIVACLKGFYGLFNKALDSRKNGNFEFHVFGNTFDSESFSIIGTDSFRFSVYVKYGAIYSIYTKNWGEDQKRIERYNGSEDNIPATPEYIEVKRLLNYSIKSWFEKNVD